MNKNKKKTLKRLKKIILKTTPAANREGGDEANRRRGAEPQWIVRQAHFHTYGTPSTQSRLQRISGMLVLGYLMSGPTPIIGPSTEQS